MDTDDQQHEEDRSTPEEAFGDSDMKTLDDLDPAGARPDGRDSSSSAAETPASGAGN